VMAPIVLSPLTLGNSRLAAMASLYSEWKPNKLILRYQPGVGEFNNGSYMLGYSRDPTQIPVNFSAATNTIVDTFSLSKMYDFGTKAEFMVSKAGHLDCIRGGDWKGNEWLSCCGGDAGGIVSKLYTAGIVFGCMSNKVTGSDGSTALTGTTGKLFLDWDITFRGDANNEVARAFSATAAGAGLQVHAAVTSGNPLSANFFDSTFSDIITFGNIVVAYPDGDVTGTGFSFADNAPLWLRNTGANQLYTFHTSLYDAIHNSNPILATNTVPANQNFGLGAVIPYPQISG